MNRTESGPKFYIPTLSDLLKLTKTKTIYAKSNPNSPRKETLLPCPPDTAGGGDAPQVPKCACRVPDGTKSASDRGKTGAGVTGSRTGSTCKRDKELALPAGATNPGLLRHIHNAARYRLPQCFEGACVSVKQRTHNNWVLGHSMSFSSVTPGGYKVLLSYVDKTKAIGLPYFVMEAAPGGQMSCEIRVGPSKGTRATIVAQMADRELYSFESIFDAYFNNFTTSVIGVNKEFIALHYLQAITDQISLGAEVVARGQASELSSASGAARWVGEDHSVSATLGNRGLDLCYARAIKPFLTVSAMLEVGFAIRRAVATMAYEWHTDAWTVRGSVDSDGLVGATLQRALGGQNTQLACAISALLNHPNDKFRLGFGITGAII
ncbi:mitochondrial import receptor subunit TOM40 homolog 2-like [Pararge aegeria]|uniref:Jg10745 protein n=1 Tax=Pararge aegeria aegeria TaxID=348720 RepID=A0A8S4RIN2_9NEOP|nr:mitochondrial import receptor subunit TOM40 homolog 2-like [Pararge aegeria]CAH2236365.1 jg10745 [Pararge aegeria aegeria]